VNQLPPFQAPHSSLRATLAAFVAAIAASACGSVDAINDRAVLARTERVELAPDPTKWMRPTPTEYHIGPRDLLEIDVFELEEPGKSKLLRTRVSQDGRIVLPLIGAVPAAGRTVAELQTDIETRLGQDYLVQPSVSLIVAEYQSRRVTVLGAVQSPGTFTLKENTTTLVDVLALAGGTTDKAGSTVYLLQSAPTHEAVDVAVVGASANRAEPLDSGGSGPRIVKIDLIDLVERGDLSANRTLADGDVVHVPPAPMIFVTGKVHHGGAFPLRGEITLLQAIALAGGLKDEASPAATQLIRKTETGQGILPIDLTQVEAGSDSDLLLRQDDVLVVVESGGAQFARGFGSFLRGLFHIGYSVR
jgi:polysaccharide export outer membrane protein